MTETNDTQPVVVIFVGNQEENPNDFLYAELQMDGIALHINMSADSVEELSAESFLDVMGQLLNDCLLVSRQLFIEVVLDETIEDLAEEIKPGLFKDVERMLFEAQDG